MQWYGFGVSASFPHSILSRWLCPAFEHSRWRFDAMVDMRVYAGSNTKLPACNGKSSARRHPNPFTSEGALQGADDDELSAGSEICTCGAGHEIQAAGQASLPSSQSRGRLGRGAPRIAARSQHLAQSSRPVLATSFAARRIHDLRQTAIPRLTFVSFAAPPARLRGGFLGQ